MPTPGRRAKRKQSGTPRPGQAHGPRNQIQTTATELHSGRPSVRRINCVHARLASDCVAGRPRQRSHPPARSALSSISPCPPKNPSIAPRRWLGTPSTWSNRLECDTLAEILGSGQSATPRTGSRALLLGTVLKHLRKRPHGARRQAAVDAFGQVAHQDLRRSTSPHHVHPISDHLLRTHSLKPLGRPRAWAQSFFSKLPVAIAHGLTRSGTDASPASD